MIALSSPPSSALSCPELPTTQRYDAHQVNSLFPLSLDHESLTTQPHGLSPFISLTLKEEEGTALFKNMFVISFFLSFFFSLFAECVRAIHIDII